MNFPASNAKKKREEQDVNRGFSLSVPSMYSYVQSKFPLNRVESPLLILAVTLEGSVAKTNAHPA